MVINRQTQVYSSHNWLQKTHGLIMLHFRGKSGRFCDGTFCCTWLYSQLLLSIHSAPVGKPYFVVLVKMTWQNTNLDKKTDRRTDRRYQMYYLSCYAVDKDTNCLRIKKNACCFSCYMASRIHDTWVIYSWWLQLEKIIPLLGQCKARPFNSHRVSFFLGLFQYPNTKLSSNTNTLSL